MDLFRKMCPAKKKRSYAFHRGGGQHEDKGAMEPANPAMGLTHSRSFSRERRPHRGKGASLPSCLREESSGKGTRVHVERTRGKKRRQEIRGNVPRRSARRRGDLFDRVIRRPKGQPGNEKCHEYEVRSPKNHPRRQKEKKRLLSKMPRWGQSSSARSRRRSL